MPSQTNKKTILITGAAGSIGKYLRDGFQDRYDLKLTDIRAEEGADIIIGDLRKIDDMMNITRNVDVVIHLAAHPDDRDFHTQLLPDNIEGTYNVFEACRQNRVERIVYASTNHVIDGYAKDRYVTLEPEDFEKLPLASKHTIELQAFVSADEIDPATTRRPTTWSRTRPARSRSRCCCARWRRRG